MPRYLCVQAWEVGGARLQDSVVEALFKFYFEREGHLGDDAALCDVAASAGMDRDAVARYGECRQLL